MTSLSGSSQLIKFLVVVILATIGREMSEFQGRCDSTAVLPNTYAQLSGGGFTDLKKIAAIVGVGASKGQTRFKSYDELIAYKKAQALASLRTPGRPRDPIYDQIGRSVCVCASPSDLVVTVNEYQNVIPPYLGIYGMSFDISWTAISGATYVVTTDYYGAYTIVNTGPRSTRLYINYTGGPDFTVTVTAATNCGPLSSSGTAAPCFLAGTPVTLADGTEKPIEAVIVGDRVRGAFGEVNEVLALHQPLLGTARMCCINGDHHTSAHHPHISVSRQFFSADVATVEGRTYGREHEVIDGSGSRVKRMLHGLRPGRVAPLSEGVVLQTVTGPRSVGSVELYDLPPTTQLYNLVVGGSHTYCVDGYAVTGWPREDDFDYDAWTPTK